ncbi:hypothetical protein Lal_00023014 [Lupinus albus]|nr:hypothetical protein Lal_00023014 [Lupinus albus]
MGISHKHGYTISPTQLVAIFPPLGVGWMKNGFGTFLGDVVLHRNKLDSWEWRHERFKQYSVKLAYTILSATTKDPNFHSYPYRMLWKAKAPMKVKSFAWRLFHNKIPTKEAFPKRGVTFSNGGGMTCLMCNGPSESIIHLFSSCSTTYSVWQLVYK